MRWIGLAIVLLAIPLLAAYFGDDRRKRDVGIMWAVVFIFCTGPLQVSASLIAWPAWQGVSKGIILSLTDSIVLGLLFATPARKLSFPHSYLFVPYFLTILMSITRAAVPVASFFVLIQLMQMLVLYVVFSRELQNPSALRALFKGLTIGLWIQALFVISQKLGGAIQASGTMAHQNILGMMVELSAIPLIVVIMEGERSKWIQSGVLAGALILAGGGSRGAIGFFLFGAVFAVSLSLLRRSTMRKMRIMGIGLLAALIALPLGAITLEDRFGDTPITSEEEQRGAFEKAAVAMGGDYLLGVGSNNFVTVNNLNGYATRAGLDTSHFNRSKPVHNAWLLARAETGWGGELALVLMFGGLVWLGVRAAFSRRKLSQVGLVVGPISAIVAIGVHNNFEYAWHLSDPQRLFFVNAALIAASYRIARRKSETRRAHPRPPGNSKDPLPSRPMSGPETTGSRSHRLDVRNGGLAAA